MPGIAKSVDELRKCECPRQDSNLRHRLVESLIRIEAGQLDRAAVLAADLSEQAERHGFDLWRLRGAFLQAAVGALAALSADHVDPTTLAAHIATITTLLDTLRRNECRSNSAGSPAAIRADSKASFTPRLDSRPHRSVTHNAGWLPASNRGRTSLR